MLSYEGIYVINEKLNFLLKYFQFYFIYCQLYLTFSHDSSKKWFFRWIEKRGSCLQDWIPENLKIEKVSSGFWKEGLVFSFRLEVKRTNTVKYSWKSMTPHGSIQLLWSIWPCQKEVESQVQVFAELNSTPGRMTIWAFWMAKVK